MIHSQWLLEHFVPLFKDRLRDEVADQGDRDAEELFLDVDDVQAGMDIADKIADGLKTARCLVALLSPSYFRSKWCLVEWDSFPGPRPGAHRPHDPQPGRLGEACRRRHHVG